MGSSDSIERWEPDEGRTGGASPVVVVVLGAILTVWFLNTGDDGEPATTSTTPEALGHHNPHHCADHDDGSLLVDNRTH